jgi:hypothetical protein
MIGKQKSFVDYLDIEVTDTGTVYLKQNRGADEMESIIVSPCEIPELIQALAVALTVKRDASDVS